MAEDDFRIKSMPAQDDDYADLAALIRRHAAAFPEKAALVVEDQMLDWAGLARQMDATAAALETLGLGHGDVLGLLGEPSLDCLVTLLAGLAIGACVVPLPSMVSDAALAGMIADSGTRLLVLSAGEAARAAALPPPGNASPPRVSLDGMARDLPSLPALAAAAAPFRPRPIAAGDRFNIIYSSGTTGVPKGIVHDQLFRNRQLRRMREFGQDETRITLVSTAIYSNTTLVAAFAALGNGGTLVMMPKFSVGGFLALVARARPTHTTLVPVQVQRILADPGFDTADLSSLVSTVITSSPLAPPIKHELLRRWPGKLFEMYGMTEGGLTASLDLRLRPDKLETVGLPSATADLRIIGTDLREVAKGVTGEIVGRSATMMRGYHGRPGQTAAALVRLPNGHDYLRTGDLGHLDDEGYLHVSGRAKDVILSGGHNIHAADLEAALLCDGDVLQASVIGVPDPRWGETPVGFVVLREGRSCRAEEIRDRANLRLGKVQRLASVRLVRELPVNGLGKVVKVELRAAWRPDEVWS